ncbi:hypothetical protein ACQY0O_000288 [Thecaphora frezii]
MLHLLVRASRSRALAPSAPSRGLAVAAVRSSAVKPGADSEATVPGGGGVGILSPWPVQLLHLAQTHPRLTRLDSLPLHPLANTQTEDIANSSGAYEGDKTNPHSASAKIEEENKADFSTSATNPDVSEAATKKKHASDAKPSQQQQTEPSRTDLGATEARKQHRKKNT